MSGRMLPYLWECSAEQRKSSQCGLLFIEMQFLNRDNEGEGVVPRLLSLRVFFINLLLLPEQPL